MKAYYNTDDLKAAFVEEALDWVGAPFLLNGRSREGVGCGGLIAAIHENLGALPHLELPIATGREGDQRRLRKMSEWMKNLPYFEELDPAQADIGDIVTFRNTTCEFHLGGFLGPIDGTPKCIIHACPGLGFGASVSNLLDPTYEDRLVACWRVVK